MVIEWSEDRTAAYLRPAVDAPAVVELYQGGYTKRWFYTDVTVGLNLDNSAGEPNMFVALERAMVHYERIVTRGQHAR